MDIKEIISLTFGFGGQLDDISINDNDSRIVNVKSDGKWYKTEPEGLYGRSVFLPITINNVFLPYAMITINSGNKMLHINFMMTAWLRSI